MKQQLGIEDNINNSLSNGNIPSLLRKMAIPGVISQILLLLYNMVDRIYLGRRILSFVETCKRHSLNVFVSINLAFHRPALLDR